MIKGAEMTEKIDKKYLGKAAKNLKGIYKKLGYSPTSAEYDGIAETQFKLRVLKINNIKLDKLKEVAGIPKRKPGFSAGQYKGSGRAYIFCEAYNGKIASTECMPGYREKICRNCKSKQKNNTKALPDIPEEIERSSKYDLSCGNKHMNGNDIYLTDISAI
jgi:hypothetical protein